MEKLVLMFHLKMLAFVTNPKIRSSLEQIYSKKELENLEKLADLNAEFYLPEELKHLSF